MDKLLATFFSLMIGGSLTFTNAQQVIKSDSLSPTLKKVSKEGSQKNFIRFKEGSKINPKTIFAEYKAAFDLKENDRMVLRKTEKDELGFNHFEYQQYYKNIKVEDAIYKVHSKKEGESYAANGKMLSGININTVPDISSAQAIEFALKHINAKEYKWQSAFWENELKESTGKPDTSYYPVPELVIKNINENESVANNETFFLVYRMDIYTSSPNYAQRVFVDARTGEILVKYPLQYN